MGRITCGIALASIIVLSLAATAQAHRATCTETTNPHGNNIPRGLHDPAGHQSAQRTEPGWLLRP